MTEDSTDLSEAEAGLRRVVAEAMLGLAAAAAVAALTVLALAWIDTWGGATMGLAAYASCPLATSAFVLLTASGRIRSES